jgi:hypothetical protein
MKNQPDAGIDNVNFSSFRNWPISGDFFIVMRSELCTVR